ncbi:hypothetical protein TNCV_634301 [Trichonephila clavipes]|nr:hypothetical protein TNCV_634301 [Trichonephila clavipes]
MTDKGGGFPDLCNQEVILTSSWALLSSRGTSGPEDPPRREVFNERLKVFPLTRWGRLKRCQYGFRPRHSTSVQNYDVPTCY